MFQIDAGWIPCWIVKIDELFIKLSDVYSWQRSIDMELISDALHTHYNQIILDNQISFMMEDMFTYEYLRNRPRKCQFSERLQPCNL